MPDNDELDGEPSGAPGPFIPEKKESKLKAAEKYRSIDAASSGDANFVGKTQKHIASAKKMRILIPSTETQREDVFVQVNGVSFQIKRDVEVDIPTPVLEALNNAVQTVYTQTKRPDGEGYDMVPRDVMRFPYRVVVT